MTRKEYNAIVDECNHNTCYSCGCVFNCNRLKIAGIKTPIITYWKFMSDEAKQIIMNA